MCGALHEHLCTFMLTSGLILVRMGNISHPGCTENQNIHFVFNNFFPENRAVYGIM